MIDSELIERQKIKVQEYMANADPKGIYSYHNWKHVTNVICAAEELLKGSEFDTKHKEDIMLAAIWHDADFAKEKIGHENRSAKLAENSLRSEGLSEERTNRVSRLVLSTEMARHPEQEDERLIKDADLAHLGSSAYMDFYYALFKEINTYKDPPMTENEWLDNCIDFTGSISYHTEAAQKKYGMTKQENLRKLKEMKEITPVKPVGELSKEEKKRIKKEKKKNEPKYNAEKGIETMFRLTLKNHITLSRIADDKANTLISVNAIILSIVLSALFPKLDSNPWLIYPGMSLILVSISTIILATLSTIPKTTHGTVSKEDVKHKRGNLLFFGNFHQMTLPEYEWGIGELMKDGEYLYGSLTRDLYFLGLVLNRKYSLLRRAYFVFVIGLLISIVLFVWSVISLAP